MAQKFLNSFQAGPSHNKLACESIPQVMKSESLYPGGGTTVSSWLAVDDRSRSGEGWGLLLTLKAGIGPGRQLPPTSGFISWGEGEIYLDCLWRVGSKA